MNLVCEGGYESKSAEIDCELLFNPFPRASSTLITAPSYSGKSLFLKKIIERQDLYFRDPIERVVILNCNRRVSFYSLEQRPDCKRPLPVVEEHIINEFDFESLQDTDICIVEDLQSLSENVRLLLTTLCHHANLVHVFVIAHGVLGQRNFEILSLVHRVLLFMQSTSVGRLSSYIVQHFFIDPDVKELLKRVVSACAKTNNLLLLEINNLPASLQPYHVAISHLLDLLNPDCSFVILYPYPTRATMYANLTANTMITKLAPGTLVNKLPAQDEIIEGSFVLLNRANVVELKNTKTMVDSGVETGTADVECVEKDQWNSVVLDLETQIEDFILQKFWFSAKSLLKEILRNDQICILSDGRQMRIKSRPQAKVGITDFITVAIRKNGPAEYLQVDTDEYRNYRLFARCMLDKHCPKSIFKNKLLIQHPSSLKLGATKQRQQNRSSLKKRKPFEFYN